MMKEDLSPYLKTFVIQLDNSIIGWLDEYFGKHIRG